MTATSLNLLTILLYFVTWVLITLRVRAKIGASNNHEIEAPKSKVRYTSCYLAWFIALVIHIIVLNFSLIEGKPLSLNFFSLGSYVMWFISLALFITTLSRKIESLGLLILPLTILSLALPIFFGSDSSTVINLKSGLGIHVLTSLIAYSFLMLASFQALLLSSQNNRLHTHQSTGFFRTLPSLEDMEHLLFRFIGIGLIVLTISLLSGFYYLDNLFDKHFAHKTVLSIFSWVIFSALLLGRWKYGWRGKKAVRWTLTGFIVLMLAFFGTKFVQEFLL
jgi:ABC-type uncharacterized transport system permease subunit